MDGTESSCSANGTDEGNNSDQIASGPRASSASDEPRASGPGMFQNPHSLHWSASSLAGVREVTPASSAQGSDSEQEEGGHENRYTSSTSTRTTLLRHPLYPLHPSGDANTINSDDLVFEAADEELWQPPLSLLEAADQAERDFIYAEYQRTSHQENKLVEAHTIDLLHQETAARHRRDGSGGSLADNDDDIENGEDDDEEGLAPPKAQGSYSSYQEAMGILGIVAQDPSVVDGIASRQEPASGTELKSPAKAVSKKESYSSYQDAINIISDDMTNSSLNHFASETSRRSSHSIQEDQESATLADFKEVLAIFPQDEAPKDPLTLWSDGHFNKPKFNIHSENIEHTREGPQTARHLQRFISSVGSNHVYFGRGEPIRESPGNKRFRRIVDQNMDSYNAASRAEKGEIIQQTRLQVEGDGSRFFQVNKSDMADGAAARSASDQSIHNVFSHRLRDPKTRKDRIKKFQEVVEDEHMEYSLWSWLDPVRLWTDFDHIPNALLELMYQTPLDQRELVPVTIRRAPYLVDVTTLTLIAVSSTFACPVRRVNPYGGAYEEGVPVNVPPEDVFDPVSNTGSKSTRDQSTTGSQRKRSRSEKGHTGSNGGNLSYSVLLASDDQINKAIVFAIQEAILVASKYRARPSGRGMREDEGDEALPPPHRPIVSQRGVDQPTAPGLSSNAKTDLPMEHDELRVRRLEEQERQLHVSGEKVMKNTNLQIDHAAIYSPLHTPVMVPSTLTPLRPDVAEVPFNIREWTVDVPVAAASEEKRKKEPGFLSRITKAAFGRGRSDGSNKRSSKTNGSTVVWCWKESPKRISWHETKECLGNEEDCWIRYEKAANVILEAEFQQQHRVGECMPLKGYKVDFHDMEQINLSTGYRRKIQRVIVGEVDVPTVSKVLDDMAITPPNAIIEDTSAELVWCWKETCAFMAKHHTDMVFGDSSECWVRYNSISNTALEEAFRSQQLQGSKCHPMLGYIVDFSTMRQTNLKTGFEREIQRVNLKEIVKGSTRSDTMKGQIPPHPKVQQHDIYTHEDPWGQSKTAVGFDAQDDVTTTSHTAPTVDESMTSRTLSTISNPPGRSSHIVGKDRLTAPREIVNRREQQGVGQSQEDAGQ